MEAGEIVSGNNQSLCSVAQICDRSCVSDCIETFISTSPLIDLAEVNKENCSSVISPGAR